MLHYARSQTSSCTLYSVTVIPIFCIFKFFKGQATFFGFIFSRRRARVVPRGQAVKQIQLKDWGRSTCATVIRKLQSMVFKTAKGGINSSIVLQILFDDSEDSYFISIGLKTRKIHADGGGENWKLHSFLKSLRLAPILCLGYLVRCCGVLIKISRYQLIKDKQPVLTWSKPG